MTNRVADFNRESVVHRWFRWVPSVPFTVIDDMADSRAPDTRPATEFALTRSFVEFVEDDDSSLIVVVRPLSSPLDPRRSRTAGDRATCPVSGSRRFPRGCCRV